MEIGLYKEKLYRIGSIFYDENQLNLVSDEKGIDFREYIDRNGKTHYSLFINRVFINDLEDAYELDCKVLYKGREFDVSSSMANIIKTNKLIIGTLDYPLAEELGGFERVDKYYYEKEVSFNEIDKFLEVKKPLFHFKNIKSVTTKEIPKDEIIKYTMYIESFA